MAREREGRSEFVTWATFGISTVGALVIAGMTINPQQGIANLQGWERLIFGRPAIHPPPEINVQAPGSWLSWLEMILSHAQVVFAIVSVVVLVTQLIANVIRRRGDA